MRRMARRAIHSTTAVSASRPRIAPRRDAGSAGASSSCRIAGVSLVDRSGNGTQRLQIIQHAQLLQDIGQEPVDAFPAEQHGCGNDRIAQQQSRGKEDASIADASQSGRHDIPEGVRHPVALPVGLNLHGIVRPEQHQETQQRAAGKNHGRRDQPGAVFPGQEHLAPRGREEPEMQCLIQHLAPEEIHENAEAAEEYRQPQVEKLKHSGKYLAVFFEIQQRSHLPGRELAVRELQPGFALPVEIRDRATRRDLVHQPRACPIHDRSQTTYCPCSPEC